MRTTKKIITTFLAAGIVSTAAIGSALADFKGQGYGDLNGDEPVSIHVQRIQNAKALQSSVKVNAAQNFGTGDLNGDDPISIQQQRVQNRKALNSTPVVNASVNDRFGDLNGDEPLPVR